MNRTTIVILAILIGYGCIPNRLENKVFKTNGMLSHVRSFPLINDSAIFISDLKKAFLVEGFYTTNQKRSEKITAYEQVKVYGSNDVFYLVEYDFGDGCMADFPWKYQFLITQEGKLLKKLSCIRYELIEVFEGQNPLLLGVTSTSNGNGGHQLFKMAFDSLVDVFGDNNEIQTYDACQDHQVFKPYELSLVTEDQNMDGVNDIIFQGVIVLIQGELPGGGWYDTEVNGNDTITYSIDYPYKEIDIKLVFTYSPKTGLFMAEKDYQKKYGI